VLLLTACTGALFASVGATSASADTCGGLVFNGNFYVGDYRAAGVEVIEPLNRFGLGKVRQYQKRWRDRDVYKVCTASSNGRRYHMHYRYYGEDTRSRICFVLNYWPIGCGGWTPLTWHSVPPGLRFVSSHWIR